MIVNLPNFHWIIEGVLAGMARPGSSFKDPIQDLAELSRLGFSVLVTLTETPLPLDVVMRSGLAPVHIPIDDFAAPAIEQGEKLCALVDRMAAGKRPVAMHCYAGLGRTGTMAAAYLMHREGIGAGDAVRRVREIERGYIQSDAQVEFLDEWEAHLASGKKGRT